MATNKVIGITIDAEVNGTGEIESLARELDDFAKVADGDAAQAAKALSSRVRELGEQQAAVAAFLALKNGVNDTARALAAAEKEANSYAEQITRMGTPTEAEAANLRKLRDAAEQVGREFAQQRQELAGAQAVLQRYGIAGDSAKEAQQRLRNEIAGVRDSARDLSPAFQQAASGVQGAGQTMVRSNESVGESVQSIGNRLSALQGLLAGFVGVAGIKSLATDFAEVADEVNNLQSRIKLVTGEGDAFAQSWAGVSEVALRTNSALEETGTLFTRLAQAGKDAGLSAEAASTAALGLTQTINQAVQLSGASAQGSSAAITQLIQGLQSGVLRGEEFNSVMEQTPRLARALADGLGVTTGELRNLAQQGALSSEVVIEALRGQRAAIESEFGALPQTVGRAMQNLTTQWSLFISETDKTTGASAAAATAIDALANNLDRLAGLLIDAGQAGAAFIALRLAQSFVGIGAAAQQAAVAVAAHNAQLAASGAAAAGAAAAASRFAAILSTVRTFTLVGVVANIKDIGTWLGEAAARAVGFKDATKELADAERVAANVAETAAANRERMAALLKEQLSKQYELTGAARASVAEFEKLTKEGASSAEALKRASDAFDLGKISGIRDYAAVLDKLASDGKVSASEFEKAWAQALSGKDLAQFEVMARAAFAGTAREGERVAQVMEAILGEAVRRTGLDFDSLQGKIGAASRSALNDLDVLIGGVDRLKEQGIDAGRALSASFINAIDTADSQEAVDLLRGRIEEVRKVLGDKVADGLLDQAKQKAEGLREALDKATPGINSAREAMKELGVVTDATLKDTATKAKSAYDALTASGVASARELGDAFKSAADKAIAANNGVAPVWVQAQAQARGYRVEVDEAGKATLKLADATDKSGASFSKAANDIDKNKSALERLNEAREREIASQEKALELQERELELMRKRMGMDKEGFSTNAAGQRVVMDVQNRNSVYQQAKSAGLTASKAEEIAGRFISERGDYIGYDRNTPWDVALAKAIGEAVRDQDLAAELGGGNAAQTGGGRAAAPAPAQSGGFANVVNITIGSSTRRVPTTDAGVGELEGLSRDFVRLLEEARGVSV